MPGGRTRPGADRSARSYRLHVPGGWFVVDLDRDDPAAATALVDEHLKERADLAPYRDAFVGSLETFIGESREREALDAALFLDIVEGLVLTATIQTMLAERDGGGDPGAECARLAATLADPRPGDTRVPDLRLVDLGAGPAVRVANAREAMGTDGPGPVVEYVEHWIPVAGRAETLLVLGETPHLAFASDIAAAFDRIVATLVIQR